MKSGKVHQQEEEEEEDDEFGTKKDATTTTTTSTSNARDGKSSDKAAMRSKHSVTEQRRRSKINERFQILRDLIPHSDQKRDTASFLLEVIQYVQYLNEKVQKYEGSYQPWGSEPTKLMPWRNSHWRVQNLAGQSQSINNGSGPVSAFPGRFDESSVIPTTMQTSQQNSIESDPIRDASCRPADQQNELPNKTMGMVMPVLASLPVGTDGAFPRTMTGQVSDLHSTECRSASDALNHQDELTVEGGTISISSVYSQGLLNSLAQALQSTGVDLSQANISVQINLGKRANKGPNQVTPSAKNNGIPMSSGNQPVGTFHDSQNNEDLDQAHKRQKV